MHSIVKNDGSKTDGGPTRPSTHPTGGLIDESKGLQEDYWDGKVEKHENLKFVFLAISAAQLQGIVSQLVSRSTTVT